MGEIAAGGLASAVQSHCHVLIDTVLPDRDGPGLQGAGRHVGLYVQVLDRPGPRHDGPVSGVVGGMAGIKAAYCRSVVSPGRRWVGAIDPRGQRPLHLMTTPAYPALGHPSMDAHGIFWYVMTLSQWR